MFDEIERIGFWNDLNDPKNEIKEEVDFYTEKNEEDVEIIENIK